MLACETMINELEMEQKNIFYSLQKINQLEQYFDSISGNQIYVEIYKKYEEYSLEFTLVAPNRGAKREEQGAVGVYIENLSALFEEARDMKTHSDKKVVEERINEHNESAANLILSNIGQIGGKPFKNKRTYRKRKRT